MNYYIQGDAARADKIRAAFENKGYSDKGFTFDVNDILFFTANNKHINVCPANGWLANIIKTHPDYKELELLAEPKFKVGDWVVKKDGTPFYGGNYAEQITNIEDDGGLKCIWFSSGTWLRDKDIRLWTIQDAKDGDVLVTTKIRSCPFIYRKTDYNNNLAYYYAGIDSNGDFCEGCLKRTLCHFGSVSDVIPATKEQRDLLFAKMKEAGYEWDANKKELRKIKPHYDISNFKPHYDISNFKPFDKVLVKYYNDENWKCGLFSHLSTNSGAKFVCVGSTYVQCIPFDGNEHLLGTTDMPSEEYINW